jgi:hypothetical protein
MEVVELIRLEAVEGQSGLLSALHVEIEMPAFHRF